MYSYLIDSKVSERRFEQQLNKIEFRIIELGINGRIDKLNVLKNMQELIDTAVKRGAETIVVVGNDEMVVKAVSMIAAHDVTLGIIPIGSPNKIAHALGIPSGEAACDVLSKRIVKTIDLGKANEQYFLFSLRIPSPDVTVECDGRFQISIFGVPKTFAIYNFFPEYNRIHCNPEDGVLEAVIEEEQAGRKIFRRINSGATVVPLRRAKIQSRNVSIPLLLDGQTIVKTPVQVEIIPRKLRVIVGKDRLF
jgi:diacylglycerol kinase family enzyme